MTTEASVQVRSSSSTRYNRLLQKGMAVVCFLFPLLYLVSAIYFITSLNGETNHLMAKQFD